MAVDAINDQIERETRSSIMHNLRGYADLAAKEYARMEARLAGKVVWYPRSETPPVGQLWASDGETVWLIYSDGMPFRAEAGKVLYWTQANIPMPPDLQNPESN